MGYVRVAVVTVGIFLWSTTVFAGDWMNTTDPAIGSKGDVLDLQQRKQVEQNLQVTERISGPLQFVVGSRSFGTVLNVIGSGKPIFYTINTSSDTVYFHVLNSLPFNDNMDKIPDSTFYLVVIYNQDTARFRLERDTLGSWHSQVVSMTRDDYVVVYGERLYPAGVTIIPIKNISMREAAKLYKRNRASIIILDEGFYPYPNGGSRFCKIEKISRGGRRHKFYMNRMDGSWIVAVKNNGDAAAWLASSGLLNK